MVRRALVVGAIALLVAAAALAAALLPSTVPAAAHKNRLIVSPKAGKVLGAHPVRIRIRAGRHVRIFRAQLNGSPIARQFSRPSKRGIRNLRATPIDGLRHGRNRLHVRVKRAGHKSRSRWMRFRIRRNRPLAAAGHPRKVNAGQAIYLDSTRSRSHLRAAGQLETAVERGRRSKLRHEWQVVRTPKGAPLGASAISGDNTPTPRFKTTVPGRYRLKLEVTARDGKVGTDTLTVNALNPPLVSVDTMTEASGDKPGIRVGGQDPFYADTSVGDPWFQVVVFNGKTLVPRSNKTYPCIGSSGGCDAGQLTRDLKALDDTDLVIAANHLSAPRWFDDGTRPFPNIPHGPGTGHGSYSLIGVPDGEGNYHLQGSGTDGRMEGSLIIDNTGYYSYLPPKVTFDTQVFGSNDAQNVMEVAGTKVPQAMPLDANQNGRGGFHVLVIDRMSLHTESKWFPTGLQNFDSGEAGRLDAMTSKLQQANSGNNIVIIASRGNPAVQGGREDQQLNVNNSVKSLVDQIEALGGTRTAAFHALVAPPAAKSGASYTLIGHSGAGVAHGVESQGQGTTAAKALNSVPLSGTLARGHDYGFDVGTTSPSQIQNPSAPPQHMAGQKLDEALVQAPTQWPGQGDLGKQNAIAYIGQQKFAGDDIRTDYWKSGKGDTFWQTKKDDIAAVSYPGGSPGFSAADLDWAKGELRQEITWLLAVHDFTRGTSNSPGLASPFAKEGLQSWADMNAIATQVDNSVAGAQKNKASLIAGAIFDGAREIASEIPVVGEGIGVVNQIYDTALEITKIATEKDEPAGDPFKVDAANVGSELVTRLNAAQDTLTTEMTNVIVADYGKLKTVGACYLLDTANCPDNPQAWKFDADDQLSAAKALRYGAELQDYAALVPAKWTLWQLSTECDGATDFTCWETDFRNNGFYAQVGLGHVCPFLTAPRSTKMIRPKFRDIPNYRNNSGFGNGPPNVDIWQTYALGNLVDPGGISPYRMDLPSDFLTRLFAAPDPAGNISKGGLGAQPEQFFLGNMTPKLIGNGGQQFPYNNSKVSWGGGHDNDVCPAQP